MIIKSFVAESASAALKMVRQELGGDAIVLKTRQLPQGRGKQRIEITACVEKHAGEAQTIGQAQVAGEATATPTAVAETTATATAPKKQPPADTDDIVPEPVKKRIAERPTIAAEEVTPDNAPKPKPSLSAPQSDVPPMEKIIEERRKERLRREEARRSEQEKLDADRRERSVRRSEARTRPGTAESHDDMTGLLQPAADGYESAGLMNALANIEHRLDQMLHVSMRWPADHKRSNALRKLHDRLIDSDVPANFVRDFIQRVIDDAGPDDDVMRFARNRLAEKLTAPAAEPIKIEPGDSILFIGPAGSGKSSVMGKLAARLVGHERKTIRLATLDVYKMGAHEEICSYADVLGVDMVDASGVTRGSDNEITLIDAPAVMRDEQRLREIREKIDIVSPKYCFAVLSALTRSSDVNDITDLLADLSPTHLVMTMLDLTDRYGGILTATLSTGLPMAYVTDAPGGIGSVANFDSRKLADALLRYEVERG